MAAPVFFEADLLADVVFVDVFESVEVLGAVDGLDEVDDLLATDFFGADAGFPTTSDWPGKITARRRPFARMSCAVVM